jgi:hypothetical protein
LACPVTNTEPAPGVVTTIVPQNCQMQLLREWLRVTCDGVIGLMAFDGAGQPQRDYFAQHRPAQHTARFVFRVRSGMQLDVTFCEPNDALTLSVGWPNALARPQFIELVTQDTGCSIPKPL